MQCDRCNQEIGKGHEHVFVGRGYTMNYCKNCCPIDFDGLRCNKGHTNRKRLNQDFIDTSEKFYNL